MHDKARLAADAAELPWLELGYGYKLALIDLQNQLIKLGSDKSSAHAVQRAMHAAAEHAHILSNLYCATRSDWGVIYINCILCVST